MHRQARGRHIDGYRGRLEAFSRGVRIRAFPLPGEERVRVRIMRDHARARGADPLLFYASVNILYVRSGGATYRILINPNRGQCNANRTKWRKTTVSR